jgi:tetratricopeptide (TPR) repeat protein
MRSPFVVTIALVSLLAAGCRDARTPLELAKAGVRSSPQSAPAYLALAGAYSQEGLHNDAYVALCTAERLDPTSYDTAYQLGLTMLNLGSLREALGWARMATRLRPGSAQAHELVGRTMLALVEPEPAIAELKRAVALDGDNLVARLNLTAAYAMKGDKASALSQARAVVQLKPDSGQAHFNLADLLERTGDRAGAEDEYQTVVRLEPRSRDARARLAALLLRQRKDLTTARLLAQSADRLEPGDGTAAAMAAWALFLNGERIDAVGELDAVLAAHPNNYQAWLWLAEACRSLGHDKLAKYASQRAADLAPRPARNGR